MHQVICSVCLFLISKAYRGAQYERRRHDGVTIAPPPFVVLQVLNQQSEVDVNNNNAQQQQQLEDTSPNPLIASPWLQRVKQLLEYAQEHGDCLVPKRYQKNPALGNWVNKQRVQYRLYTAGNSCSLTPERIKILEQIGFCWDASHVKHTRQSSRMINDMDRQEEEVMWWSSYQELQSYLQDHQIQNIHCIPFGSKWNDWVRATRQLHAKDLDNEARESTLLTVEQVKAMNELDPFWHLAPREARWERKFQELIEYRDQFGDCCVPISFDNKQLANWVSTQRKQRNIKELGERNGMTPERQRRLESIGFVWNRWEYDFAIKQEQSQS